MVNTAQEFNPLVSSHSASIKNELHQEQDEKEKRNFSNKSVSSHIPTFLKILSGIIFGITIFRFFNSSIPLSVFKSSILNSTRSLSLLILCTIVFTAPGVAFFGIFAFLLTYVFYYNLHSLLAVPLFYLVIVFTGSLYLAHFFIERYFSQLLINISKPLKKHIYILFAGGLLCVFCSGNAFFLLSLHLHKISWVFLTAMFYLAAAYLVYFFTCKRTAISHTWHGMLLQTKEKVYSIIQPTFDSRTRDALSVLLFLLLGASFLLYMGAGTIAGDSNKAYLAFPRFYSLANALLLLEPGWTSEHNVMAGYHHTQEMVLSTGYLLGKTLGAKYFMWSIVLLKIHALYALGRYTFRMSSTQALFMITSFMLIPICFEMNSIERPENMMTLFCMYTVIILEFLSKEFFHKEEEREVNTKPKNLFSYAILIYFLLSYVVSIKLTALFFIVALIIAYPKVYLGLLKSLKLITMKHVLILFCFTLICCFWFIRNYVLWGFLVNMTPYGQYHLTIWFPPIRDIQSAYEFLTGGFIYVKKYTEFVNLGYGVAGFLIVPVMLVGLAKKSRILIVSFAYVALILLSTTQIRYLAPVIPLIVCGGYAILFERDWTKKITDQSSQFRINQIAALLIFFQVLINVPIVFASEVGPFLKRRLTFQDKNLIQLPTPYSEINKIVKYPQRVLAPYIDSNYMLRAKIFRGDPYLNLHKIAEYQKRYGFTHWLTHSSIQDIEKLHFGDVEFLESVADPLLKKSSADDDSWWYYLFRYNEDKFKSLVLYVKQQNWDLKKTAIVSENLLKENPFYIQGERIVLNNLRYPLYRLYGVFHNNGALEVFDKKAVSENIPTSWYFEDLCFNHKLKVLRSSNIHGHKNDTCTRSNKKVYTRKRKVVYRFKTPVIKYTANRSAERESSDLRLFAGSKFKKDVMLTGAAFKGTVEFSGFKYPLELDPYMSRSLWVHVEKLKVPENTLVTVRLKKKDRHRPFPQIRIINSVDAINGRNSLIPSTSLLSIGEDNEKNKSYDELDINQEIDAVKHSNDIQKGIIYNSAQEDIENQIIYKKSNIPYIIETRGVIKSSVSMTGETYHPNNINEPGTLTYTFAPPVIFKKDLLIKVFLKGRAYTNRDYIKLKLFRDGERVASDDITLNSFPHDNKSNPKLIATYKKVPYGQFALEVTLLSTEFADRTFLDQIGITLEEDNS
jgi:hypothetical protein